jgi:putative FmdB family regulatory protein
MPVYEYRCTSCEILSERVLSIKDCNNSQACGSCGSPLERLISANLGMVLKGDGWPGKAMKVNGQMARKNRRLDAKSEERRRDAPGVKLVPNVNGEQVNSWSEAKSLAGSLGKDTSSYDPLVQKEKADT